MPGNSYWAKQGFHRESLSLNLWGNFLWTLGVHLFCFACIGHVVVTSPKGQAEKCDEEELGEV